MIIISAIFGANLFALIFLILIVEDDYYRRHPDKIPSDPPSMYP
jgi:hypothetical protein